jgi:putative ABC transport system ATP-binding protein
MKLIEIKNITKTYHGRGLPVNALSGVSLNIEEGEFAAIAGPSGSGKTTLLNTIGGLDTISSGRIIFDNEEITSLAQKQLANIRLHKMGFVFQAYNLIPVLTALENVEFVMLLQRVEKATRREKAKQILDEVGLSSFYNRKPYDMSGGQQQRVAVARAVVTKPKLVLADEPTANLDSETAAQLIDTAHKLNRERKVTFLFSTHDKLVMEKADRLIQIKDGLII